MPGYRQILSESNEVDYTIDNERIYNRMYERLKQKRLDGGRDQENQSLYQDSDHPMQDIMPIESVYEYESSQAPSMQNLSDGDPSLFKQDQSIDRLRDTSRQDQTPANVTNGANHLKVRQKELRKQITVKVGDATSKSHLHQQAVPKSSFKKVIGIMPDDSRDSEEQKGESGVQRPGEEFGSDLLNEEQDKIEVRQVRNVAKMMS